MKSNSRQRTIRYQILHSFSTLTGVIIVLVGISFLFFRLSANNYNKALNFQKQQYAAQQVISSHYQWLEQLSDSITTGNDFQGSLDPASCALGQWIANSEKDLEKYPQLSSALSEITAPTRKSIPRQQSYCHSLKVTVMPLMKHIPLILSPRYKPLGKD